MTRVVVIADRERAEQAREALSAAGIPCDVHVPESGAPEETADAVVFYRETMQRLAVAGTLAAGAAHDIANVVTALSVRAALDRPEEAIAEIRAGLDRLRGIAAGLTAFAKPATHSVEVHAAAIAREAAALVGAVLRGGALLEVKTDGELGPRGARVRVRAGQLTQVIVNLLLNAGQAVARRGGGRVTLSVDADDASVFLRVQDDGDGMSAEQVRSAFEPFVTSRADGSGLGLYVCKHVVEDHGGSIRIDSLPGVGTLVEVALPRL